ncbi:cardiomyopathy-associated protein 5-like isoform X2 [Nerophis ophidion]|uniref:cardiomyopathy-associated protein 5-like isoform X2 n=1 Tax=Nerophis ophidion TaxID=159077 RepID=UPI002AE02EF8|nr:cardiomyopathy-associated protein 5-like isoform X2 [Nerophis ophidion]
MCERKTAKYEDELSRTKEENRRRLRGAVFQKHQVVSHGTDVQQLIGCPKESLPKSQGWNSTSKQGDSNFSPLGEEEEDPQPSCFNDEENHPHSPHVKEEEEEPQPPHFKEEKESECLQGQEEADIPKFPLTVVSVKTEDHENKPHESSQLHHSPNIQQLIVRQKEPLSQLPELSSPLKQEKPQPPHFKVEEEKVWITQQAECLLGQEEADPTKFPLTVVSVKIEDKPPESSQLHHSPSEEKREVEPPSSSSPQQITTEDPDHDPVGTRPAHLMI